MTKEFSASLKRIPPALALFVIAPVFGELFSGSSPLNEFVNPITFLILALLYGCGAIIVRELVIRWNKGWLSMFLLGLAYGIYEEGIMVQSFFDPTWMDLGALAVYGRVAGVNWVWAEHLAIFHALISIAASVAFVETLYPEQRQSRWVTSRLWWWGNWIGFLGVYLIWELATTYDPGIWKWISWLAVLFLVLTARLIPAQVFTPVDRQPLRPRRRKFRPRRQPLRPHQGLPGQWSHWFRPRHRRSHPRVPPCSRKTHFRSQLPRTSNQPGRTKFSYSEAPSQPTTRQ